ncbi:hypothetical protein T440DRAFT_523837 [Plenodomus tracheiphilus IPT5]|uniref:Uncharacterized protein n=1 Tax=Plenodomus tracheiphilus IPT5 TaxID=1408161 RepID=A0A6A7ANU7_9PLEO|nr:hypothetical protein T440DRAFT_523837 [Plenodomus tracheiphilus IPT5]
MSQVPDELFAALSLVKRFVDSWLGRNEQVEMSGLERVVEALDMVKTVTQQKLAEVATPPQPYHRSLRSRKAVNYSLSGGAGDSSHRRRPNLAQSLFVPADGTDEDSNSEDGRATSWHENPSTPLPNNGMPAGFIDNAQEYRPTNDGTPNAHTDTPLNSHNSSEYNFDGLPDVAVQTPNDDGDTPMHIQGPFRNDSAEPLFSNALLAEFMGNAQEHEPPNDGAPHTHEDTPSHFQRFSEDNRAISAERLVQESPPVFDELNHFLNHEGLEDLLFGNNNGNMERGSTAQAMDQYMQDADEALNHAHEGRALDAGQEDLLSVVAGYDMVGNHDQDVHLITEGDLESHAFEDAFLDDHGQPVLDQVQPRDFSKDPEFEYYVDLARQASFRLPQIDGGDTTQVARDVDMLLSPLLREGTSLSPELLHGLIYILIPGPLHIQELLLDSWKVDWDLPTIEAFSAILMKDPDTVSMLVLGDPLTKTVHLLQSDHHGISPDELIEKRPALREWRVTVEDVHKIDESTEATLMMVHLAELWFMRTQYVAASPSAYPRALRLRFLSQLVASSEQERVLTQCGVPEELSKCQRWDTRRQVRTSVSEVDRDPVDLPELDRFNMQALREVVAERPAGITRKRWLRILQCVNEIGSTQILSSVKLSLQPLPATRPAQKGDQPFVDKLLYIHLFLNGQETLNHVLVAKSRYMKYVYYEAFRSAVESLSQVKHRSNLEQQRLAATRLSASFKAGLLEELPPTPHSDQIREIYSQLNEDERKRRAPDMVKDEIVKRVLANYRGYSWDEKNIRSDVNRYIKEGKALHFMLQGSVCLSPTLFLIFPSCETQPPSLNVDLFPYKLISSEAKALKKPVKVQE